MTDEMAVARSAAREAIRFMSFFKSLSSALADIG